MTAVPKDKTQTPIGRNIERALTSLNNQYCFFLFLESQFFEDRKGLNSAELEQFTTERFPKNKYAPKIRRRLRELPLFRDANREASFGAYFATSYEIAASFTRKALKLLSVTNSPSFLTSTPRGGGPENKYLDTLQASGYHLPDVRLIDTLSYMRFRRNTLVHLLPTPSLAYTTLAGTSGASLNTFWMVAKIHIDLTVPVIGALGEREALDLLKITRIIIRRLDSHLATIIDPSGLVELEAKRLFGIENIRMNKDIETKRVELLRHEISTRYGIHAPNSALRSAASTIGIRVDVGFPP